MRFLEEDGYIATSKKGDTIRRTNMTKRYSGGTCTTLHERWANEEKKNKGKKEKKEKKEEKKSGKKQGKIGIKGNWGKGGKGRK